MTGDEYHYLKTYKVTNSVLFLFITTFFFLGSSKFAYEYIPAGATHVVVWRPTFSSLVLNYNIELNLFSETPKPLVYM